MIKAILLAAAKITEYCQLITGVSRKATMALIKRIELPGQRCILGDWKLYVQNYHEESWIFASLSNIDSEMAHKISTTDVRAALNQGRNSHDYGNTHIRSVNIDSSSNERSWWHLKDIALTYLVTVSTSNISARNTCTCHEASLGQH